MNPLLQKQFETLESQIQQLREVLERNTEKLQQEHGEKLELRKKELNGIKELNTLRRIAEDFDEVDEENKRYREERDEIHEDLANIMNLTKALRGVQAK